MVEEAEEAAAEEAGWSKKNKKTHGNVGTNKIRPIMRVFFILPKEEFENRSACSSNSSPPPHLSPGLCLTWPMGALE